MLGYITEKEAGLREGTSREVISFLAEKGVNLHSLILMRNGKIFSENYADGYDENFKHRMYSVSKTFVSAAVGVLTGEGKISLDDRIAEFFPDKMPAAPHPYLTELTVRDCLTMSTPFNETAYSFGHKDWVSDFFNAKPTHRGGSLFHYDTAATLVLDDMVRRVSGLPFNEYLYEKVLRYAGFSEAPACVECPDGVKWGGSGIFCTSREFAEFSALFMNGGRNSEGRQLIPEWYVNEAVSKRIGNYEDNQQASFRGFGYGYQIWRTMYGFALFGMGNQLALCCPDQGVMLVCTGDDQGNALGRAYIFDALGDIILSQLGFRKEKADAVLGKPAAPGEKYSPIQDEISGREYTIAPGNRTGMEKIRFTFGGETGKAVFFARGKERTIRFGMGHYETFDFPEDTYSGFRMGTPLGKGYRSTAAAAWDMPDSLLIKIYAEDLYFGVLTANVRFSGGGVDIHFTKTAEDFFNEYNGFLTGVQTIL